MTWMALNLAWSNSIFDAISGNVPESPSSSNSSEYNRIIEDVTAHKKSVRFNEVVQRQVFRSNSTCSGKPSLHVELMKLYK